MKKIVVLFSGNGGNLHNIIKKLHKKKCEVVCAITNNPEAQGLKNLPIKSEILKHNDFNSRKEYDKALVELISTYNPDLTVLAGFMRILTSEFTANIKAINLHPSLLPRHKGAGAIQASFTDNETKAGVTVHWVEDKLDAGEIISQQSFTKDKNDTLEGFTSKIKELEYTLLPKAIVKVLYEL